MIAKQGADEKAQLEQWKEDLVSKLTYEMAQLRKAHEETTQAQYREMENQRISFTSEIEVLKKEVREIKRAETEDMPGPKTAGKSLGGPSKFGKIGAATPPSQENIQESINSSLVRKT